MNYNYINNFKIIILPFFISGIFLFGMHSNVLTMHEVLDPAAFRVDKMHDEREFKAEVDKHESIAHQSTAAYKESVEFKNKASEDQLNIRKDVRAEEEFQRNPLDKTVQLSSFQDHVNESTVDIANRLEDQAKNAKTSADIKKIIGEIDMNNVLPQDVVEQAVQAAKTWMNPFDTSKWQDWVEVVNILITNFFGYKTTGQVEAMKSSLTKSLKIKSLDEAKQIEAKKIESKKNAQHKAIDDQIDMKFKNIMRRTQEISDIESQISIAQGDLGLQSAGTFSNIFGDSADVIASKAKIKNLEEQLSNSKSELAVMQNDLKQLEIEKDKIDKQDFNQIARDVVLDESNKVFAGEHDESIVAANSNKVQSKNLCDSIEGCIKKMNNPSDEASLSSLFAEMKRISQEPDFVTRYNQGQQEAVKYFAENGDKIINNTDGFLQNSWGVPNVSNIAKVVSYAKSLPIEQGSGALDQSVLTAKGKRDYVNKQAAQKAAPNLFAVA